MVSNHYKDIDCRFVDRGVMFKNRSNTFAAWLHTQMVTIGEHTFYLKGNLKQEKDVVWR